MTDRTRGTASLALKIRLRAVKLKKESFRFHPFRVAAGGEGVVWRYSLRYLRARSDSLRFA
jgi:hypothetical protein